MDKAQQKKRIQLSFIIQDPIEKLNRNGINCLKYDHNTDRLYSAGRDSIIRAYNPNQTNPFLNLYSGHTDWVNDLQLCNKGQLITSASSDTTIKIWNVQKCTLIDTLKSHNDYVKCLAYAKDKDMLVSGSFDKNIFIWDLATLSIHPNTSSLKYNSINDNKFSIYSLAINNQGTLLASGSPENCIRLWDPRSTNKLMKLKGHTHNIRCLCLNKDGTQLLSASSDGTIKLWSIGQQRCIHTFDNLHLSGVWTLCVNETFSKCLSSGRDGKVYTSDLKFNSSPSVLVCEVSESVLSVEYGSRESSVWVASASSDIKNWNLKDSRVDDTLVEDATHLKPLSTKPRQVIKGASIIKNFHILNDKRFIITKDNYSFVSVWDVLTGRKIEDLGNRVCYEQEIKSRQKLISVPNWFTVDLKLGLLTINLDENECLTGWSNINKETSDLEIKLASEQYETKVNYGSLVLEALFRNYPKFNLKNDNKNTLRIPEHTPLIFSEVSGRTLYRIECKDLNRESEKQLLENIIPAWIHEALVNKNLPKISKLIFSLAPYVTSAKNSNLNGNQNSAPKDKLSSIELLQVKKIKEHVATKILKLTENSSVTNESTASATISMDRNSTLESNSTSTTSTLTSKIDDMTSVADKQIDIYCSDQIIEDANIDLRTIKQFIWKGTGDLLLHYKLNNETK